MIGVLQAKKMALNEKSGFVITNSVRYRDYYVFFMQPKGVNPNSEDAVLDSFVFVNFRNGKIEYKSPWMFDDFVDRAVPIR